MADLTLKTNGMPRIESVKPAAALPGGEVSINGSGFGTRNHTRPQVQFGTAEGSLILAAEDLLIARVPKAQRAAPSACEWAASKARRSHGARHADRGQPASGREIPPWTPKATSTSLSAASAAKKFPSRFTKSRRTTR